MALEFYQNNLDNITRTPNQTHLENAQALYDSVWDNSTQTSYEILEQSEIGSEEYFAQDISVDMAIDFSTGMKKSDDWKIFSYRDISHNTTLGIMYKFADNYWLTVNTGNLGSPLNSVMVRRCNNVAKWVDKETGEIKQERCVIDYSIQSPNPKVNKDLIVQNGHIVLIIQGNENTLALKKNQRFLFNGEPYKLTGYNNMLQNGVVDDSTTLLYYDLYLDIELPTDDIENNIANRFEYNYQLSILENPISQIQGFSGVLTPQVTFNGEIVPREVKWESNDYGTIDNMGNYILTGEVGTTAIFTCLFGDLKQSININIVESVASNYEIVIEPIVKELRQNKSIKINADLYKDGIKQNDIVTVNSQGADDTSYSIVDNNNNEFTLTCLSVSKIPLVLTFTSGEISKSIEVNLKALF